jgi:D-3-phosphoglycerate dehydrogenase
MKPKVFIATYPFGKCGRKPIEMLENEGYEVILNPLKRRLKGKEIIEQVKDVDVILAGTEKYPLEVLDLPNLKAICRVGIGLDNVALKESKEKGIKITYTPDAPSPAVAELTIGFILDLVRKIHESDKSVREGFWNRYLGFLLKEITIGIVGVGRIGERVIRLLQPFEPKILATDWTPNNSLNSELNFEWTDIDSVIAKSDIISLHIPGDKRNHNFVNRNMISKMKTGAMLVNTARGTILDENALYDALLQGHLSGAALDVFKEEPYNGPLQELDNIIFTAHMGASANEARFLMELGAAEDCIRVLKGEEVKHDAIKENPELLF